MTSRKVWKEHPMFGKRVTYRDGGVEFKAEVVNVKVGPMLATIDMDATDIPLTETICLLLKPDDASRGKFWTAPMEYKD